MLSLLLSAAIVMSSQNRDTGHADYRPQSTVKQKRLQRLNRYRRYNQGLPQMRGLTADQAVRLMLANKEYLRMIQRTR